MDKDWLLQWLEEGVVAIPSLLFKYYKEIGLNEAECMLLLQIFAFKTAGNDFPTHAELSGRMSLDIDECSQMISDLIKRGFLIIESGTSEEGIYYEKYGLSPLWVKLIEHTLLLKKKDEEEIKERKEESLYTIFEQEFGRPLSPMECEALAMWLDEDGYNPELIKAALREAVLSGVYSLRYIDRILLEWKKKGIQSVEQARREGERFRQQKGKGKPREDSKSHREVPLYNWLEN